jgi:AcrR family transcriptional regulator
MSRKQEMRSEETKQSILMAARELFGKKGFDAVTMREIAKLAGCSHTTIYIYFKDKEALLYQPSMGPLQSLQEQMTFILKESQLTPEDKLKSITRKFIEFSLSNRNMYTIFFMTQATRVDEEEPILEINKLRNQMFGLLRRAIGECLPNDVESEQILAYARIYFFTLHGILATYTNPKEPLDGLLERLASTFDLAVEVLLTGFKYTESREMHKS